MSKKKIKIRGRKNRKPLAFKQSQIKEIVRKRIHKNKLMEVFDNNTKDIQNYLNAVLNNLLTE